MRVLLTIFITTCCVFGATQASSTAAQQGFTVVVAAKAAVEVNGNTVSVEPTTNLWMRIEHYSSEGRHSERTTGRFLQSGIINRIEFDCAQEKTRRIVLTIAAF